MVAHAEAQENFGRIDRRGQGAPTGRVADHLGVLGFELEPDALPEQVVEGVIKPSTISAAITAPSRPPGIHSRYIAFLAGLYAGSCSRRIL